MKRLPKLWRKKRGGREVGSWLVTIDGEDINLRTQDANEATRRRRDAVAHSKRNFEDELAAAAELEGDAEEATTSAESEPPPSNGLAAQEHAGTAATSSSSPPPPPPPPDPPPPSQDAGDAEDMAAAAADVAGDAANDNAAAAAEPVVDEAVLDTMLEQGALVFVDLQLGLQAYAIKRGTGLVPGAISPDNQLRTGAAKAWAAQLKIWFPSAAQLPPWAMALILPAMCVPAQLAGARKPTPEELAAEKGESPPKVPEAQAAA